MTNERIAELWAEHGVKGNVYIFARALLADGGKGDEHDSRMWDAGYSAGIDFERRRNALKTDGGKGEAVALWAAFAPEGNLLAHSKLRPGLSDILNWEPLYRTAPQAECAYDDEHVEAFQADQASQAETVKWGCPICHGGVEGWKCLCAPTPEREAQPVTEILRAFDDDLCHKTNATKETK